LSYALRDVVLNLSNLVIIVNSGRSFIFGVNDELFRQLLYFVVAPLPILLDHRSAQLKILQHLLTTMTNNLGDEYIELY
jgi:hypothetical protein